MGVVRHVSCCQQHLSFSFSWRTHIWSSGQAWTTAQNQSEIPSSQKKCFCDLDNSHVPVDIFEVKRLPSENAFTNFIVDVNYNISIVLKQLQIKQKKKEIFIYIYFYIGIITIEVPLISLLHQRG